MRAAATSLLLLVACSSYEQTAPFAPPPPAPRPAPPSSLAIGSVLQAFTSFTTGHDHGGQALGVLVSLGPGYDHTLTKQPAGARFVRVSAEGVTSEGPHPAVGEGVPLQWLPTAAPGRFAFLEGADRAQVLDGEAWQEVPLPGPVTLDTETRLSLFSATVGALRDAAALRLWNGSTWSPVGLPEATAPPVLGPWSADGQVRVVFLTSAAGVCTALVSPAEVSQRTCVAMEALALHPSAQNGTVDDFQFAVRTAQYLVGVHFKDGTLTIGKAIDALAEGPGMTRVARTIASFDGRTRTLDFSAATIIERGERTGFTFPHFSLSGPGGEGSFADVNGSRAYVMWLRTIEGRRFLQFQTFPVPTAPADVPGASWPARCSESPAAECTDGSFGCSFACPELHEFACVPGDAGVTCLLPELPVEPIGGRGLRVSGRLGSVLGHAAVRFEALDGGAATDLNAPPGFFSWNLPFDSASKVTFDVPDAGGRIEPVTVALTAPPPGGTDLDLRYVYLSQGRRVTDAGADLGRPVDDVIPIPGSTVALLRHANRWRIMRGGAGPHDVELVGEFVSSAQRPVVLPDGRTVLFPGASTNTSVLVDVTTGQLLGGIPGSLDTRVVLAARSAPCAYFGATGVSNVWCWQGGSLMAWPPNVAAGASSVNLGRFTLTADGTAYVHFDESLRQFERRGLTTADRETIPNPTHPSQYAPVATVAAGSGFLVIYRAQFATQRDEGRLEAVWKSGTTWNSQVVADGLIGEAGKVVTALAEPVAGWLAVESGSWQVMRFDGRTGMREVVAPAPGGAPDFISAPPRVSGDWLIWASATGVHAWNVLSAAVESWPPGTEVQLAPNGDFALAPPCARSTTCGVTVFSGGVRRVIAVEQGDDAVSLIGGLDRAVSIKEVSAVPSELWLQPCGATCRVDGNAELVMRDSRPPFHPIALLPEPIHTQGLLGAWGMPCVLYTRDEALPTPGSPLRAAMCAR